ncbi:ABC transporter substrate-binding protein [Vibrio ostreicida]|uniref:ABC transporter substrate-binding protein n=1 Tax=Vibrio ostreicida TaxID=526588 RepID=A0ABT8BSN7_9VIBR|nr:ABC transporter substrate-binding protein [Vibrio ostreicida]MDN3610125.1 ABC transporter substrate-binding protein [Vibrio ostreicida]NPD07850.1 ABC transporter substrate-binding protein [Vibrio ostreicida]
MKTLVFCILASITLVASASSFNDEKHVIMVLWRGVTDAERGFMDYLSDKMEVRYTLLDAQRDKDILKLHLTNIDELKPDLIYTFGTTITLDLLGTQNNPSPFRTNSNTPVVFSIVTDPVGSKIVDSLDSSGRNFTGVSHIVPHNIQFKAINQLSGIDTIGIIFNPLENNAIVTARSIQALSSSFQKEVYLYPLRTSNNKPDVNSVERSVSLMVEDGVQLAYLPPDSYIISQGKTIVDRLHQQGIATFSATESPIRKHAALFGIVSRYYNVGQFAGHKAEQILSGKFKPSEVPIEPLTQYSYIVNVGAAQRLDYYPPVSILKISELIGGNEWSE